ncbi:phosphatidylserine/phosphatidylglycerophosphate/cardiolipin synthase family protein [Duganella sp. HH101]|uniref:phospholipase D-like domain-containing protein n=1 Tax=Duganella sp. HH101 TaxID=1781066 RepID=UPI000892B09F|nr:phospholipase D-like domain-containing protein [Duganella sp. HH101]OEZ99927.1 cardiolipin synthase [Duganella sp. HH101]
MSINEHLYLQTLSYRHNAPPSQCLAPCWFVRVPNPVYYPRYRCSIEPLICGEEVFERIAKDLESARQSVDIITWGFDPGMVLVRGSTAEEGTRYGDLLKEIATRKKNPVRVRLLVWHDDVMSQELMKNIPGYYGKRLPSINCILTGYYSESHQAYSAEWFSQVCAGEIPNIQFHVRDVPTKFLDQSLSGESAPSNIMAHLGKVYAAHHQKMLLVDYERPKLARGYVMGHNSLTDFWDTKEHKFRDKRRERVYSMDHVELQKSAWKHGRQFDSFNSGMTDDQQREKERSVQSYIDAHSHVAQPYQDVSCRVRGPILYDLNHNFCQAWQESKRPSSLFCDLGWLMWLPQLTPVKLACKVGDLLQDEMDPDFIARRKRLSLDAFDLPYGHHNLQLVRTQPLHAEKSIKECYANLTRQMLHYIFIQNQYIQYEPWAEFLIECVGRLRAAGYLTPIYVFMLTSTPERGGMDRPTYDVASKVGMSSSMRFEHEEAVEKARKSKTSLPITPSDLARRGINVFMGSLWTCADTEGKLRATDYEEIYIHAKVAIVDDAAFTIGSANLNLRSMALDSELNVLSEAKDVAYQLRVDLFSQCVPEAGPQQFGDMENTFKQWEKFSSQNLKNKAAGIKLVGQLLPFHVDRKPGMPVV